LPELPDITVYIEALEERIVGKAIERVRLASPFLVRSYDPPLSAIQGKTVRGLSRLGKRIVWELDEDIHVVIHLMIAGRLRWLAPGAGVPKKLGLCAFDFSDATLLLTEASKKKRASLHVVRGKDGVEGLDPGGIEVMGISLEAFREALTRENHTLKRTLTDPHVFSGVGNAYSDEILHRARLSPVKWTTRLSDEEVATLHEATQTVLLEWTDRLRAERAGGFPEKVTAFRPEMAVHGKYKQPCPVCGAPVQRIVRGEHEVNYCPKCQTEGRLLADFALSRLLKGDWPKTLEELEERKRGAPPRPRPPAKKKPPPPPPPAPTPPRDVPARLLLFAPGAGAPSTSEWMSGWAARLGALGSVVRFDYPYMLRDGRSRPDPHDTLVAAHRAALAKARAEVAGPVVLAGKSMGGRIGCHLSLDEKVAALVCFGYPLIGQGKEKAMRDEILLELATPILFVQGTRDALCPLDELEKVQKKMRAPNELFVVESGDHSLIATKTWLKSAGLDQAALDLRILAAVEGFLARHAAKGIVSKRRPSKTAR
jgi:formamidopyrimidine-DNA glycosylase